LSDCHRKLQKKRKIFFLSTENLPGGTFINLPVSIIKKTPPISTPSNRLNLEDETQKRLSDTACNRQKTSSGICGSDSVPE
jgi:hypothetical protein